MTEKTWENGRKRCQGFWQQWAVVAGAGWLPKMPGTWGSLAALPLAYILVPLGWWGSIPLLLITIVSFIACARCCAVWGNKDHQAIVCDEFVAMLWALWMLPVRWDAWLLAVVCFRLLDIYKPWPISWADRRCALPASIMWDDLLAAALVQLLMRLYLLS